MPPDHWPWLGDIHLIVSDHWAGVITTVAAVICGGAIGFERGRAQKPAGLRTLILICLGSAIFTQASILMSAPGMDRARIAAQVVTGIGFLGGGAIMRERGFVIGVTTGAGVWAVAAVGVVLGSGYVVAGFIFTLIIFVTLAGAAKLDSIVLGPCSFKTLRLTFDPAEGRTRFAIQAILDENAHEGQVTFEPGAQGREQAHIRCCFSHRHHRSFLKDLMGLKELHQAQLD